MPGASERMRFRKSRQRYAEFEVFSGLEHPPDGECEVTSLFAAEPDGMEARQLLFGQNSTCTVTSVTDSTSEHLFVADGTVHRGDGMFGPESIAWQAPDDPPCELISGRHGARVGMLRYPWPSSVVQRDGFFGPRERRTDDSRENGASAAIARWDRAQLRCD